MQKINRILIVVVLLMALFVVFLDYFGFHGTILLDRVANGDVVKGLDIIGGLFQGQSADTNLAFLAVIAIGLAAAFFAIIYKFIQG
jgi:hypothetical protein